MIYKEGDLNMGEEIAVRRATGKDFEKLCQVYANDGVEHARPLESFALMDFILSKANVFLAAEVDRKIVGLAFVRPKGDEAKIDFFSVASDWRGKGVERRLLEAIEQQIASLPLNFYAPIKDNVLVDLFLSQGFEIDDEIYNMYGQGAHGYLLKKNAGKKDALEGAVETGGLVPGELQGERVTILQPRSVIQRSSVLEDNLRKLDST